MLSVAIICRNAQATIGRTLDSVRPIAQEIVAVDSGSTDGTLDLLARAGARVVRSDWSGFGPAKNRAMDECTRTWVLSLDADESPDADLARAIRDAIERDAGPDCFTVNRRTWYAGRPLRHAWQPERIVRLCRRGSARWSGREPHPALAPVRPGPAPVLAGHLRHDSFVTFADHFGKQLAYARQAALALREDGHAGSVARLMLSPPGALAKQLILKGAWLDGVPGWLAAASSAAGTLMKHAILLELTRTKSERRPEERA